MAATTPEVAVLGIRHHGPGSARSLLRALDDFGPDMVLIEGPADADPLVALGAVGGDAAAGGAAGYAADGPGRGGVLAVRRRSPRSGRR